MRTSSLKKLCCPACRERYTITEQSLFGDAVEEALLTCPVCCVAVPVLNGFPIFGEQYLTQKWNPAERLNSLFGKEPDYERFLDQKRTKPVFDLYAAFQPFNESTQCIFPLIPLLREVLRPGDFILDLWCRTGWTGELLASLFPEQSVISIWEGSSGLLGLKGFHHWLSSKKRLSNLDIIFHSPNNSLPFTGRMFSVVHGLDTLHRYAHAPLIPECLRVVKEDGVILFPHNHLTNSQPEPYFDRGEDQLHGKDYQQYFERLFRNANRRAFILSEKTLFEAGTNYVLKDEADTDHYNACILLAEPRHEGRSFQRAEKKVDAFKDAHIIVNPLWEIDMTTGEAVVSPEAMDSGGATLFFRHPIYQDRLKNESPIHLSEEDRLILYWAIRHKTVSQIAAILKRDVADIFNGALKMESKELVQLQNVSAAMARLQSYYSTQQVPYASDEATLTQLWRRTVRLHGDRSFIVWPQDGSIFSYADSDMIVRKAVSFLKEQGVSHRDNVLIVATPHPEFVFLFWATVLLGAVVVPVNPEIKQDTFADIVRNTKPRLILANSEIAGMDHKVIQFGLPEGSDKFSGSFSERLADSEVCEEFPDTSEEQDAVILFTSGTTGNPKGVVLSHGALFRTSRILDQAYRWNSKDRFIGGGSFHTMSGLRNPCIAVLHSGLSVVIPEKEDIQNPLGVLSLCVKNDVTILNVTPGFLAYWGRTAQKSKYFQSHKLRMVLSTGSALQPIHRKIFEKQFQAPVYDYYGLTETTGACILENQDLSGVKEKGLGKPWGCLVKIHEDGELAIYSENLMLRYLNDPSSTGKRIRHGWLMTGDIARINESGCVLLIGRKDRMMKDKNGENFYPEEIETAITSLDGVAEVYVTAFQDDLMVDHIAALIQFQQPEENEENMLSELRKTLVGKIPSAHVPVLLIAVKQTPKGPGGKISTEAVNQILKEELQRSK